MSHSKLFAKQLIKAKQDIRTRYIAGESIPSIARSYDVSDRNIYHHLDVITPNEKALHVKNSSLRKMAAKKERGEHDAKSTSKADTPSLSDFIE